MFSIEPANGQFVLVDSARNGLHSDGSIYYRCYEFFPTQEDAQAVLDKFRPELKHVWKHGDVFESGHPLNPGIMMLVQPGLPYNIKPCVVWLNTDCHAYSPVSEYLVGAKFLFNIKEKI